MHLGVLTAREWAGSAWGKIWPTARRLSAGLGTTYYGLYDTLDAEKSDLFCLALSFCTGMEHSKLGSAEIPAHECVKMEELTGRWASAAEIELLFLGIDLEVTAHIVRMFYFGRAEQLSWPLYRFICYTVWRTTELLYAVRRMGHRKICDWLVW